MSRAALALVRAVTPPPPDSDAQLLRAFLDARSEEAFAELVRRHGPMVLAACRRVLSNATDADDAFQATFLVLARKAHSVRGANVAGWLYGVAVRTARGVRIMRDRRLKRETRAARTDVAHPPAEPGDADAAALVDAELARLPAAPARRRRRRPAAPPAPRAQRFRTVEGDILNSGMVGGALAMLVGVVLFVLGLSVGSFHHITLVLFVLGFAAFVRGVFEKSRKKYR